MTQARKKVKRKATKKSTKQSLRKLNLASVDSSECEQARLILEYTHDSAQALLNAFQLSRNTRGASRGTSTDEEQDLLRAMLVMAASGLDSAAKHLIRDALPKLIETDEEVRTGLEEFVRRTIRGDVQGRETTAGAAFLARILSASVQQRQVIEEYIADLTRGSLQSYSELARTAMALGLDLKRLGVNKSELTPIFDVRNKIIHELDINFQATNRNRNARSRETMMKHTNRLMQVGQSLVEQVDQRLSKVE